MKNRKTCRLLTLLTLLTILTLLTLRTLHAETVPPDPSSTIHE